MKRYSGIVVYNYGTDELVQVVIPNDGIYWKDLLKKHPEFKDDDLEWLSEDFDMALGQLLQNQLKVNITHYDKINPLTQRRQVDNGNPR